MAPHATFSVRRLVTTCLIPHLPLSRTTTAHAESLCRNQVHPPHTFPQPNLPSFSNDLVQLHGVLRQAVLRDAALADAEHLAVGGAAAWARGRGREGCIECVEGKQYQVSRETPEAGIALAGEGPGALRAIESGAL